MAKMLRRSSIAATSICARSVARKLLLQLDLLSPLWRDLEARASNHSIQAWSTHSKHRGRMHLSAVWSCSVTHKRAKKKWWICNRSPFKRTWSAPKDRWKLARVKFRGPCATRTWRRACRRSSSYFKRCSIHGLQWSVDKASATLNRKWVSQVWLPWADGTRTSIRRQRHRHALR